MGFRTPLVCTIATLAFAQFLPPAHAFILGALLVLLPLRMTIMPGNFPSFTGALSSATALITQNLGLSLWQCILAGAFIGPVLLWAVFLAYSKNIFK